MALTVLPITIISIALVIFFLYTSAKPKPIPGIPHDPISAKRLLGDIPDFLAHHAKTTELFTFLEQKCRSLDSPIIQVFMRPFSKPWVILVDCREYGKPNHHRAWKQRTVTEARSCRAHDIMTHRGREFDRSDFFKKLFNPVFPKNQISMPTNEQWRYNRLLMRDLMSPAFLDGVAAPLIHKSTLDLVATWRQKARLARNRAFEARRDVQFATLDSICCVSFGSEVGISKSQADGLAALDRIDLPVDRDAVASIPEAALPEAWYALYDTVTSGEIALSSPLGSWHHEFAVRFYPRLRRSFAFRNKMIGGALEKAWKKFKDTEVDASVRSSKIKNAADWIVEKESKLAAKGGKPPDSEILFDELAGFLQAGFDTTSSSIHWGLKYLTGYQNVQKKLRESLNKAFVDALGSGRPPTAKEISKTSLPYLDAFIEESLRHSCVISVNFRLATEDVNLLGYLIPKGTDVYMLTNGPGILKKAMQVDETKRSRTSREYKPSTESWDHVDLEVFRPERWLNEDDGILRFNPRAAAMQNFGLGVRSCYGKKLAYQNLRIIYTLIVWHFVLEPLPESISDFKATDGMTHLPQNVRLILREI